jgi:capsular polysaccharide biosynthesis protein
MNEQRNDLLELLRIALKWKKPIVIVTVLAAFCSAGFSWWGMPDYYKSAITFYPSNPVMNDRQVLYSNSLGEIEIDYFGSAGDVDRILTLAHGSPLIDYIINKFKLMEHYDYDSTGKYARYKTKKEFEKNYKAIETEYGAIEISIWDQDKQLACDIANHIALTIDNKNKELILRDKFIAIKTFEDRIQQKKHDIKILSDSIEYMRKAGISSGKLMIMEAELDADVKELNENTRIKEQYETSSSQNFSTIHITEEAYPALRKDKPVRSLIVIGATLGAFVFMLLLAIITENYKKVKSKLAD